MSHFSVGVILPRLSEGKMNAEIERLLEPYSENREVEPYEKACYCVNSAAQKHGRDMADKLVGTWADQKDAFWATDAVKPLKAEQQAAIADRSNPNWERFNAADAQLDALYQAFIAPFAQAWNETKRDYTENHPAFNQPDPGCETCDGSGHYTSTYNPQSKWDWYRVGGRFDGLVTENPQSSENGFNFAAKHETLANNSVPVQELLDRAANGGDLFTAYALVTPEGEWIGRGEMGWWGMSSGDAATEDWQATTRAVYERFKTFDIVLLDCHI
jgi:hypothetical protein